MKIALSTARRLALATQGLDGQWSLPKGKEGVAQAIERLGYVQIDTIAGVLQPLAEKLHAFAAFNGCERVSIEQSDPRKAKAPLTRALR